MNQVFTFTLQNMILFNDRKHAAEQLCEKLVHHKNHIVIALPRGGAVIGYEIAKKLHLKWDLMLSGKISSPMNPEFAIGAICEETVLIEKEHLTYENLTEQDLQNSIMATKEKLKKKEEIYKRSPIDLKDQPVILTDDGIATGLTIKAAIGALKQKKVKKIVIAAPVASSKTILKLRPLVDEVICLSVVDEFFAVSSFYRSFEPISDAEVLHLIQGKI